MAVFSYSSSIESQPASIHWPNDDWFVGHLESEPNYVMVSCSFQVNVDVLVKCSYFHVWICPETGHVPVAFVFAVYTWDYMRSLSALPIQSLLYNLFTLQSIDFTIMCFVVLNNHSQLSSFHMHINWFYPDLQHDSVIFVVQYRHTWHYCMLFPFMIFFY